MSAAEQQAIDNWLVNRDPEALRALIHRHSSMVYATSRRILRDPTEAEDVTQECFETLVRAKRRLWKQSLGAWLHGVATKRSLKRIESDARRKRREDAYAAERDPAGEPHWDDTYGFVDEALQELPAELRVPIVLHFLENMPHSEIASELGVSRQTVTYRIGKGIEQLAGLLKRKGIAVTAAALGATLQTRIAEAGTVPPSLAARLGRLALSQSAAHVAAKGALTTASAKSIWAALTWKSAVVAILAIAGSAAVLFTLTASRDVEPDTAPRPAARASSETTPGIEPGSPANADTPHDPLPLSPASDSDLPSGSVSGIVVDATTGRPLADTEFTVHRDGMGDFSPIRTDQSGRFHEAHVPAGSWVAAFDQSPYILVGGSPSFEDRAGFGIVRYEVDEGKETTGVRLEGVRGATVSGRVYDTATGKGIERARLAAMVSLPPEATPGLPPGAMGAVTARGTLPRTDEHGNYTIEGVPPGHYEVYCWFRPRRYELPVDVTRLTDAVTGADFPIDAGVRVSGRVVDSARRPVADAQVYGVARRPDRLDSDRDVTKTRDDGTFELVGFTAATPFFVQATKDLMMSDIEGPWELTAEGLEDLVLTIAPGPVISGTVVDEQGQPVARAVVTASFLPDDSPGAWVPDERGLYRGEFGQAPSDTTKPDGAFVVGGLNPGVYGMQVTPPGRDRPGPRDQQILKRVVVSPGSGTQTIRLVMGQPEETGWTIRGRVTDANRRPLSDVRVTATRDLRGSWGMTDETGAYCIAGLSEGEHSMSAERAGFTNSRRDRAMAGSSGVDFTLLPTVSVKGRVVDKQSGQPVSEFQVAAARGNAGYHREIFPEANHPPRYGTQVVDGANGAFEIDDLDAGDLTLFARAPGFTIARQFLPDTQPGRQRDDVVIELEAARPITGTVTGPDGNPLPGAEVFVNGLRPGSAPMGLDRPDVRATTNGAFTIDEPPADVRGVSAVYPGYAPGWCPVSDGPDGTRTAHIVLPKGGSIQGRVTIAGQPPDAAAPPVRMRVTHPGSAIGPEDGRCDQHGAYTFTDVAPGPVEVQAEIDLGATFGKRTRSIRLHSEVRSGETTVANIEFPEHNGSLSGTVFLNGAPTSKANVVIQFTDPSAGTETFFTYVDETGAYSLDGLPAGTVTVLVRTSGTGTNAFDTVEITIPSEAPMTQDFHL